MGDAFKTLGSEYQSKEGEIKQDVEQSDATLNEALGATAIIGFILALPKLTEIFVKAISKIFTAFKKLVKPGEGKSNEEAMAAKIVEFTHKWHKLYIKGVKWILKTSGSFKKAGITGEAAQQKAAEMVYYIIVAGLAAYSGVGSIAAFKQALAAKGATGAAGFSLSAFEAAMASVKTKEVREFIAKAGLNAIS